MASFASISSDIEQCAARIEEAEQAITDGTERLTSLNLDVEQFEALTADLRTKRDELRLNLEGLAHSVKAARGELATLEAPS